MHPLITALINRAKLSANLDAHCYWPEIASWVGLWEENEEFICDLMRHGRSIAEAIEAAP